MKQIINRNFFLVYLIQEKRSGDFGLLVKLKG
jgi:hypothetical protein